jgi:hypothetical protein
MYVAIKLETVMELCEVTAKWQTSDFLEEVNREQLAD